MSALQKYPLLRIQHSCLVWSEPEKLSIKHVDVLEYASCPHIILGPHQIRIDSGLCKFFHIEKGKGFNAVPDVAPEFLMIAGTGESSGESNHSDCGFLIIFDPVFHHDENTAVTQAWETVNKIDLLSELVLR